MIFPPSAGVSVSQTPATNCSFDNQIFPYSNRTNCGRGNWGGFLEDSCCRGAFDSYLYLLGKRANLTGNIYFNAGEQRKCLASLNEDDGIVLKCTLERLTSGAGDCSDFSVSDVFDQMEGELGGLREDCRSLGTDGNGNQTCGACLMRWNDMEKSLAIRGKTEIDVCRYAVLVSMISYRIDDALWIRSAFDCLGVQNATLHDDPHDNDLASGNESKGKPNLKSAMGFLGGGLGVMAIISIVAAWILLKRKIKSNFKPQSDESEEELPQDTDYLKIPIKEIYSATNNLSALNFIGQGIAGKVYKGVLWNGVHVAVKHIVNDGHLETFVREVRSMSHVKHPNLVVLLGHCEEQRECFLVYELCPNGNLSEWLFGKEKVLSWIQRMEIAIDSARGLWFLHTFPEGCIVHRDVKPTNILLGNNFEAKLSDFGLSKIIDLGQSYVSSEVRGTFGYVDPEYHRNHHVNSYGDVYSFGIVLLQIISGRRVLNLKLKKPMSLDKMAKLLTRGGNIMEFADPKMNGDYSVEAFTIVLKLALSCTTHKHLRPTMEKVVKSLECALDLSTKNRGVTPSGSPTRT